MTISFHLDIKVSLTISFFLDTKVWRIKVGGIHRSHKLESNVESQMDFDVLHYVKLDFSSFA